MTKFVGDTESALSLVGASGDKNVAVAVPIQ
jgi:hypothetical protein